MSERSSGTLYVVATPIGILGDLTRRAEEGLRGASLIACEDTRHTARLASRYGMHAARMSLHAHNEQERVRAVIERLKGGSDVALVSDAGLPGISDPGQRLIASCRAAGMRAEVLPGPCAPVTALAGSGFPADAFFFGGFLPNKSVGRERMIREALEREVTSVFLESPHRLLRTLEATAAMEEARPVCIGIISASTYPRRQAGSWRFLGTWTSCSTIRRLRL
ncbi:MAG TPA: 16S rRNA (cytidine(1402)-2'-O)-methyltransferase [Verrucomicrobiales bacterium]|nr:16S rRNA (cytidine(1402)-2'-O)-methyltransferase [Verrucomicrobiales bacterium]